MRACFLMVMLVVGAATGVYASDSQGGGQPPQGGHGGKMQPPQEAITACSGKAEGATCQAGQMGDGVCAYTPDKAYFACRPNNMPQGGPGGNPPSSGSAVVK